MDLRSVAVLFLWEGGEREKYAREACAACRRGFVGGWLLGCRNSAKTVFKKSELAACCRSDSGLLKNNADSRRPSTSSPPAEAEPASIPFPGVPSSVHPPSKQKKTPRQKNAVPSHIHVIANSIKQKPDQPSQPQQSPASS